MMDPSTVPWIGSAIVGAFLVVLLARAALRRRKHHPAE
jgi:MYXO-CTERM domain-containing protein